ncbi:hypothetical protein JCM11491_004354 [Sporobolomyces phaffii]
MALEDSKSDPARSGSGDESAEPAIKSTESTGRDSPSPAPEDDEDALIPSLNALGEGEDESAGGVLGLGPDSEDDEEEFIAPNLNLGDLGGNNDLADAEVDVEEEAKVAVTDSDSDDDYFEGSGRPVKRAKLDKPALPPAAKAKPKAIKPAVRKASTSLAASSSSTDAKDRDPKKPTVMVQLGGRKSDRPKPWVCDRDGCGRGFARSSDLNRHYKIHDGIRAFKCSFEGCNRDFIQKSALDTHERVHSAIERSATAVHSLAINGFTPENDAGFAKLPGVDEPSKHPEITPPERAPPVTGSSKTSALDASSAHDQEDDETDEEDALSAAESAAKAAPVPEASTSRPPTLWGYNSASASDPSKQPLASPWAPGQSPSTPTVPNTDSDQPKKMEVDSDASKETTGEPSKDEKTQKQKDGGESAAVEA